MSKAFSDDNISRTGALGKLTIVIYAPDSYFDQVMRSGVGACELVAFNGSRSVVTMGAAMITLVNLTREVHGHVCQVSN